MGESRRWFRTLPADRAVSVFQALKDKKVPVTVDATVFHEILRAALVAIKEFENVELTSGLEESSST